MIQNSQDENRICNNKSLKFIGIRGTTLLSFYQRGEDDYRMQNSKTVPISGLINRENNWLNELCDIIDLKKVKSLVNSDDSLPLYPNKAKKVSLQANSKHARANKSRHLEWSSIANTFWRAWSPGKRESNSSPNMSFLYCPYGTTN